MPIDDTNRTTERSASPPLRLEPEVEVTAIEKEAPPIIPADRRISWIGWIAAILIFIVNKKIGLALIIILIVFQKFPAINVKSLSRKAAQLLKKVGQ